MGLLSVVEVVTWAFAAFSPHAFILQAPTADYCHDRDDEEVKQHNNIKKQIFWTQQRTCLVIFCQHRVKTCIDKVSKAFKRSESQIAIKEKRAFKFSLWCFERDQRVPNGDERESKEKSESSTDFSNKRLPRVNQLLLLNLKNKDEFKSFNWNRPLCRLRFPWFQSHR